METLRRVPPFEELDAKELQSVADSMHEANVHAGAVATVERGPGDGLVFLTAALIFQFTAITHTHIGR